MFDLIKKSLMRLQVDEREHGKGNRVGQRDLFVCKGARNDVSNGIESVDLKELGYHAKVKINRLAQPLKDPSKSLIIGRFG